ncbi:MAG: hypothetical protein KC620_10665, partial [Myxococcales bacterium]|nr:hypothetical protein [Myxococcales bacterium]
MSRFFVIRPLLLGLLLVALGACSDPTTDAPDARRGGSEDASGDIIALDAARLDRGPQNDALIGDAAPDQAVDAAPDQAVDAALDMALPLDQSV